jgi:hypothetical protein
MEAAKSAPGKLGRLIVVFPDPDGMGEASTLPKVGVLEVVGLTIGS